jgi:nucleoid DNA-binding protein
MSSFLALTVSKIYETLLKNGKITIVGLGTFYRLPARKGKVYNGFIKEWVDPTYKWRIKFIPNNTFKDIICK